jgi:hypothetical protein
MPDAQNQLVLNRRGDHRHPPDFQSLLPLLRTEVFGPDAWGKKETCFSPEGSASIILPDTVQAFTLPKEKLPGYSLRADCVGVVIKIPLP